MVCEQDQLDVRASVFTSTFQTLHGIVTSYGGLVGESIVFWQTILHLKLAIIALRVLLGLFESGLYPGIAFYLSR